MDGRLAVLCAVVSLVAVVLCLVRIGRGRRRPLGKQFGGPRARPALGLEATDLDLVEDILGRNAALSRKTGLGGGQTSWIETGAARGRMPRED